MKLYYCGDNDEIKHVQETITMIIGSCPICCCSFEQAIKTNINEKFIVFCQNAPNKLISELSIKGMHIIDGTNLFMLMDAILSINTTQNIQQFIDQIIKNGKESIQIIHGGKNEKSISNSQ